MNISKLDGSKLRTMRETREFSVKSLAKSLGVTPATVYRWEWGHKSPSPYTLVHLAQVLRCKVSDLEVNGDA